MARQLNFFDEDPDRFFECLKYEDLLNGFQRPDDQDGGEADAVPIPYASLKVIEMIDADIEAFAEYLQDYAKAAPDAELPSLAQLAEHMVIGECTPEALREANARLRSLLGGGGPGIPALLMPLHGEDGAPVSICGLAGGTPLRLAEVLSFVDDAIERRRRILRPLRRDHTGPFPPAIETTPPPVLNPLSPLVRSWRDRPYPVEATQRLTKRIIPAKLAQADPTTDNRAGRLFSLAAHVPLGSQIALPGFDAEICGPALPLALYDLGNGPSSRSQAAPLALRVFIEGILAVPQAERGHRTSGGLRGDAEGLLGMVLAGPDAQSVGILAGAECHTGSSFQLPGAADRPGHRTGPAPPGREHRGNTPGIPGPGRRGADRGGPAQGQPERPAAPRQHPKLGEPVGAGVPGADKPCVPLAQPGSNALPRWEAPQRQGQILGTVK